jgi:hypothetical protein
MSSIIKKIENDLETAEIFLELYNALKGLYEDDVDYITRNNLGDHNSNHNMKRAKNILAKIERKK